MADFPALFSVEFAISGAAGAGFQGMVDADDPEALRQLARNFASSGNVDGFSISSVEVDYDEEAAIGTLRIEGVGAALFEWRDGRLEADVETSFDAEGFNPDRARPS